MKTMTPEQKIIAIAEWEGWKVAESSWHTGLWALFDPSGKQRGGSWFEPHAPWNQKVRGSPKIPPYLTSRDAICGAVARLGDVRLREYAKNLQEVCHQYCVGFVPDYQHDLLSLAKLTLATPTQLADALLLTLGHEI